MHKLAHNQISLSCIRTYVINLVFQLILAGYQPAWAMWYITIMPQALMLCLIYAHVPSSLCIYVTRSAKTEHNSAIQIFQYKALKYKIIAYLEKNSVNLFTCLVLSKGRGQRLKPGYHLICLSKRSSKIFV